ncbi:MAG: hypothetical protein ACK5CE_15830 [Actinomycetes bacterium]
MRPRRTPGTRAGAAGLGLALVLTLGACSDDDPSAAPTASTGATATTATDATDPAGSTGTSGATDAGTGTVDVADVDVAGAAVVIVATGDAGALAATAAIIDDRLAELGLAGGTWVDGSELTIAVDDAQGLSGDDLVSLLTRSGQVLLRPALECLDEATAEATEVVRAPTDPTATLTLPLGRVGECTVGPAGATGDVFEPGSARTVLLGESWGLQVLLREGPDGVDRWNELALACFTADVTCPTQRLAIESDGLILTAPVLNAPEFAREVQLGGTFTETDVTALALALNSGALPTALEVTSVTGG